MSGGRRVRERASLAAAGAPSPPRAPLRRSVARALLPIQRPGMASHLSLLHDLLVGLDGEGGPAAVGGGLWRGEAKREVGEKGVERGGARQGHGGSICQGDHAGGGKERPPTPPREVRGRDVGLGAGSAAFLLRPPGGAVRVAHRSPSERHGPSRPPTGTCFLLSSHRRGRRRHGRGDAAGQSGRHCVVRGEEESVSAKEKERVRAGGGAARAQSTKKARGKEAAGCRP